MSLTRITQLKAQKQRFIRGCFVTVLIVWLLCNSVSGLTRIRDIARPLGERANKLHGTGLVVGLNGTGDGGDSLMTMRPLAVYLRNLGNPVSAEELDNAKNVAFVQVTAELSRTGVRNGDQIDVYVSSIGGAKSLVGGKLIVTPLRSTNINDENVYAMAQGLITIMDPDVETSGVIKGGATVESDFLHQYVEYDNQGREPLDYRLNQWSIFDDENYAYDYEIMNFYYQDQSRPRLEESVLNPGMQVKGWAAFPIPDDVTIDRVQFLTGYLDSHAADITVGPLAP